MRPLLRLIPALTLASVALVAQAAMGQSTTYNYRDDDGPGRLVVEDVGPAEGVEGGRQIRATFTQGGRTFPGSGFTLWVVQGAPATTVWAFTISTPRGAYYFQGTTRSGIVPGASGGGIYHRVDAPLQKERWSVEEKIR